MDGWMWVSAVPAIPTSSPRMGRICATRAACGRNLPRCCRASGPKRRSRTTAPTTRFRAARSCRSRCNARIPRCGPRAAAPKRRAALMTAGYCHEDPQVVAERGTELVGWYLEQQRERARLVWRDYDPATVPPDYQGYYARDQRLASGPHPGEPTPEEVREQGTKFCVGTPADCIRFLEMYQALGIEEAILLCAVGPAQHQEVLHTIRLFGEQVIPHFQAREPRAAVAQASA